MDSTSRINDPPRAVWVSFLVVLGAGLAIVLRILEPFLAVFLLALVAAGLIHPLHKRLATRLGEHQRTAALLICGLLVLAILAPLFVTIQAISSEAAGIYNLASGQLTEEKLLEVLEDRRQSLDRLNHYLGPVGVTLDLQEISGSLASVGLVVAKFFYDHGVTLAKGLMRLFVAFCFWLLMLFYLLVDGKALQEWVLKVLPLPARQQKLVWHRFTDMSSSLVVGNGLAGLIQGVAGGIVFAALGLPGPVLWAVVMAILAFIPVIGISLVYLPAAIFLALAGETTRAVVLFLLLAVVATVVEYWLKPFLVGRRAHMHTLLVFLSLLGGLQTFGAVGLLMGPLVMTAFLTLVGIYRDEYRPAMIPVSETTDPDLTAPDQLPDDPDHGTRR